MIVLNAVALAGVLIWTVALVAAHVHRRASGWRETLSHYLTGLDGPLVDIGFYALSVGLLALAATTAWVVAVFYVLAGLGTAGAAVTRAVWPDTRWHIRCAGIAFGGIGVADLLASIGHVPLLALAVAAPILAVINLELGDNTAIQEKTVAAMYVAWVATVTISRLSGHALV